MESQTLGKLWRGSNYVSLIARTAQPRRGPQIPVIWDMKGSNYSGRQKV